MFKHYVITVSIILAGCFSAIAQKDKPADGEVFIDVKPGNKQAVFTSRDMVTYQLKVKSTYDENQDGKLSYDILTDDYKKIGNTNTIMVHLNKNVSDSYSITIPPKPAGFYRLHMRLNLTSYDDTIKKVFGVDPLKIKSKLTKPADFEAFWNKTKTELAGVAPQYKVTERKDLSTKSKKVYLVEMHSYNNLVIRGWLVVPTYGKKFPVHYRLPGYVVELKPNMDNDDFIAFDINVRGNGNSRDVVSVSTDTYCLLNLEDRDKYIYRGVYMDCIRGLDFLTSHSNLGIDTSKIYIEGGSQGGALGVVTAALDKRIKALTVQVPLYADIRDAEHISSLYDDQVFPFKMFRSYKAKNPGYTWDKFFSVWDYYDPQNFAPMIKCPVLMGVGLLDKFCPPRCSFAMFNHLGTQSKEFICVPNSTHEVDFNYFMFQNLWLREKLRIP
ncbi:hypothetical protein A0256_02705 [Mucilaginibacter sp. PAMC 26640]|nr:hypothetical protein A0256_02705 [Mucilaginibacter sp. PAMC 26640]